MSASDVKGMKALWRVRAFILSGIQPVSKINFKITEFLFEIIQTQNKKWMSLWFTGTRIFYFILIFMYIGTATGSSIKRTNFTLFLGLKSR